MIRMSSPFAVHHRSLTFMATLNRQQNDNNRTWKSFGLIRLRSFTKRGLDSRCGRSRCGPIESSKPALVGMNGWKITEMQIYRLRTMNGRWRWEVTYSGKCCSENTQTIWWEAFRPTPGTSELMTPIDSKSAEVHQTITDRNRVLENRMRSRFGS